MHRVYLRKLEASLTCLRTYPTTNKTSIAEKSKQLARALSRITYLSPWRRLCQHVVNVDPHLLQDYVHRRRQKIALLTVVTLRPRDELGTAFNLWKLRTMSLEDKRASVMAQVVLKVSTSHK